MAQTDQATVFWKTPWVIVLGLILILVLAIIFIKLAGSTLSRRYHKETTSIVKPASIMKPASRTIRSAATIGAIIAPNGEVTAGGSATPEQL